MRTTIAPTAGTRNAAIAGGTNMKKVRVNGYMLVLLVGYVLGLWAATATFGGGPL